MMIKTNLHNFKKINITCNKNLQCVNLINVHLSFTISLFKTPWNEYEYYFLCLK